MVYRRIVVFAIVAWLLSGLLCVLTRPAEAQATLNGNLVMRNVDGSATTSVALGDAFSFTSTLDNPGNDTTPTENLNLVVSGPFAGNPSPNSKGETSIFVWTIKNPIPPGAGRGFSKVDRIDTKSPITLLNGVTVTWELGNYDARFYWQPDNLSNGQVNLVGHQDVYLNVFVRPASISWQVVLAVLVAGGAIAAAIVFFRRRRALESERRPLSHEHPRRGEGARRESQRKLERRRKRKGR